MNGMGFLMILDKKELSNSQYSKLLSNLLNQIENSYMDCETVVGIERGGVYISKPIAELIGCKHDTIRISFYESQSPLVQEDVIRSKIQTWKGPVLIVDDLIDKGYTIQRFKQIWSEGICGVDYKIATLFWNDEIKEHEPHYWVEKKNPSEWIVFPWE